MNLKTILLNRELLASQGTPGQVPTPSEDHWAMLAGTRFVLATIVYVGHLNSTLGSVRWTRAWWDYGELAAVVAFFIISGFSIGHSIDQRPKRYLLRRIWRIWPTYLFSFICCTLPAALLLPEVTKAYPANQEITEGLVLCNLFMLQGLVMPVLEMNAPTWTLAIEEWCYVAGPVFRRLGSWVLAVLIAVSAYFYAHAARLDWARFASRTGGVSHLCFVWAWLLGFFYYRHRDSIWARLALLVLPVWLMCKANELGGDRSPFTLVAATFVVAFGGNLLASVSQRLPAVLAEVEWRKGRVLVLRWDHIRQFLIFLGNVSFPLYIVHFPIFFLLLHLTKLRSHVCYAIIVMVLCVVVYYVVDKPNRPRWKPKERAKRSEG